MKNHRLLSILFLSFVIVGFFIAIPAKADVYIVSNETELAEAITLWNTNGGSNIISITTNIVLTEPLPDISFDDQLFIGGFDTNYSISRDINAPDFSIFTILPNSGLVLEFLTLRNGRNVNGGAVYNQSGRLTLNNVFIENNTASGNGGGIYSDAGGYLYLHATHVINNTALGDGGGIYNASDMLLDKVILSGNEADNGGGLYDASANDAFITDSLISGNIANNGAGLYLDNFATTFANLTIAGNFASRNGGSIYSHNGSQVFTNSIIWGNRPEMPFISVDSELSFNYSLLEALGTASYSNSLINVDPLFTAPELVTNAPTINGDYTLQDSSPAIDAGSTSFLLPTNFVLYEYDLAFNNRYVQYISVPDTGEGFPPIDMGAYEVQDDTCDAYETFFSNSEVYEVGTINADSALDLRAAITCANNNNLSDTILLTSDVVLTEVDNTLSGANGLPTILSDYGNSLTIEGNGFAITREATASNFRIMFVDGGADLTLRDVTISGGNLPTGDGGGIAVASTATLNLSDSTISNNHAERGGGLNGYNTASMTINNSVISGNTAILEGGGIYNGAAGNLIENTIISGNTAERGGGIYIGLAPTIINTLISGNVATLRGGAIENQSIGTSIINSTIVGNNAPLAGGIYDAGLDMVITNSIHWGNLPSEIINNPSMTIDYSIVEGGFDGIENNDIDPLFMDAELATNAPTSAGDYTLQENSPAIDSADIDTYRTYTDISNDLIGNSRYVDDGAIVNSTSELDRGAYERQGHSCSGYETEYFALGVTYPIGTVRPDLVSDLVVAMRCANSNRSDDTILFTGDVTLTDVEYLARGAGLPLIPSKIISGELTIDGNGFTLSRDDNAPDMGFFHVEYWGKLTINNLTIINATRGAIRNRGILIITDSTFDNNTGYDGGAIFSDHSTTEIHLTNVIMTNNISFRSGGALHSRGGDVYITDSTFKYNEAELAGGAISTSGNRETIEIIRSNISYNTAFSYGGGIDGSGETVTIIDSVINENVSVTQAGGAMRIGYDLLIENTIISGNSARAAGAIFSSYGAATTIVNNSLITGNVATLRGGAFDNGSVLTITNTTIAGNYAPDGGAIFNFSNRPLNIINSILWGNTIDQIAYESVILTVNHSIIQSGQDGINNLDADPLFVDFQSATAGNPTTAGDFSLLAESPAIDSADSTAYLSENLLDLAGNNRFVDDMGIANTPSILDRGAYEFQGTSNDAPIAEDDSYSMNEDTVLLGNVTDNDSDIEGDTLTVTLGIINVSNGTLVLNSDGSFTYTPDSNFNGSDSFSYTLSDGNGGSDTATVTIMVNVVNDAPIAEDDSYSMNEDTEFLGNVTDNDSDVDGDALTVTLLSTVSNGVLVLNSDGSFTYTPSADYFGSDSFSYTLSDSNGGSNSATVAITVNDVAEPNTAPVANDDSYSMNEDTEFLGNVTDNDSDVDGDALTVTLLSTVSNGVLVLNSDGSFTYTPRADYFGSDSFSYTLSDGNGGSDTATVTITVNDVAEPNTAPVANDDSYSMNEDTELLRNVTDNDSDVDGDALTVTLLSTVSNGVLVLNSDGSFTYTPRADYFGSDSFSYTLSDGNGGSDTATVTITVNDVAEPNTAPVANDDSYSMNEDTVLLGNVSDNDSDVDGDALTVTLLSTVSNGVLVLNSDGSFTYTPSADYFGSDSFSYTLSDSNGGSNSATVAITVNDVAEPNTAPVANDDSYSMNEDTEFLGNVTDNDSDVDGDALTVTLLSTVSNGVLVLNSDGSFTYTPSADYFGSDSFSYTLSDDNGGSNSATVAITVNDVAEPNTAPVANDDSYSMNEDTEFLGNVTDNDSDVDGDALTVTLLSTVSNGVLVLNSDGSFTYTPSADYFGSDSFSYTLSDSNGGSNSATVAITVSDVIDTTDDNVSALATCWVENPNDNTSSWQITNPNSVPLVEGTQQKVVYSWEVFDAEGNVLQSAENWDQTGSTRVNTVLAYRIVVTWAIFDNSLSAPIGTVESYANNSSICNN